MDRYWARAAWLGFVATISAALIGCSSGPTASSAPSDDTESEMAIQHKHHAHHAVHAAKPESDGVAGADGETANAAGEAEGEGEGPVIEHLVHPALPQFCGLTNSMMTPADCDALKQQKDHLAKGIGAFAPPDHMLTGQQQEVIFALDNEANVDDTVAATGADANQVVKLPVSIGRYMTAKLDGGAFDIQPEGPADRDLGATQNMIWKWLVTPKLAGDQKLTLQVSASAVDSSGKPTTVALDNRTVTVTVKVDPHQKHIDEINNADQTVSALTPLTKALVALLVAIGLLIGAISAIRYRIKHFGEKDDGGKDHDTPESK